MIKKQKEKQIENLKWLQELFAVFKVWFYRQQQVSLAINYKS